jgi:hypothetical protein
MFSAMIQTARECKYFELNRKILKPLTRKEKKQMNKVMFDFKNPIFRGICNKYIDM